MGRQEVPKRLGTTAHAVLGLLALRDWSTYELAVQMERGIGRMWNAAPSMVYEEPKHLVRRGLASVRTESVGRRRRAVYSITPAGRQALADWLAEPSGGPALQFESLLKVLFCDQERTALGDVLGDIAAWADSSLKAAQARAAGYLDGDYISGVDLDRRAVNVALAFSLLNDVYHLINRWSAWAAAAIKAPDGGRAEADRVFHAAAGGRPAISRPIRSHN